MCCALMGKCSLQLLTMPAYSCVSCNRHVTHRQSGPVVQDLQTAWHLQQRPDACTHVLCLLCRVASAPAAASPAAVASTLEMLRQAVPWQALEAAAEQEAQRQAAFFLGPDIKEGLAAVKEKRQPEF